VLSSVPINIAIPAWSKEQVSLLNSTVVGFLIAVPELMAKAKSIAAQTYDPIGYDLAVAIVYLAIVYLRDAALR
jgi:ABC-type arginine/histidine transport system permease subunit